MITLIMASQLSKLLQWFKIQKDEISQKGNMTSMK